MKTILSMPYPDGEPITTPTSVCSSDDGIGCFYQVNDPSRIGAINTKSQNPPYKSYYILRCSRGMRKREIYQIAEDQKSDDCLKATRFTELS